MKRRFSFVGVECANDRGALHPTKNSWTVAIGTESSGKLENSQISEMRTTQLKIL